MYDVKIVIVRMIMRCGDKAFSKIMIFIGGRNLALSMLCNIIPPVGLLLFTSKSI